MNYCADDDVTLNMSSDFSTMEWIIIIVIAPAKETVLDTVVQWNVPPSGESNRTNK